MSHPSFRAHRAVLGALLGLALGCSAATTAPSADASDRQAAFNPTITPTAVSLAPGGTQAFTASSTEKASWTASGGTIDATASSPRRPPQAPIRSSPAGPRISGAIRPSSRSP